MYVPNIIILAVKFRKILERSALNKKYMKMTLMQYLFYRGEGSRGGDGGGGDVRRVV